MNVIRESFLLLDSFSLTFKIFYGPLTGGGGGGAIAPMDLSLTGILVRASRMDLHADNIWLSKCQVDFASSTLCGSLWWKNRSDY